MRRLSISHHIQRMEGFLARIFEWSKLARKTRNRLPYLFEACRLMSIKPGLHDQSYLSLMTPSWISWQHAREPGPVPRIPWRCTSCLSSPVEASVVRSTRLTGREAVRLVQLLLSLDITLPSQNIIRSVGSNRHSSSISFYKYHSDKTCFGCGYIWNLRHIQVTLTTYSVLSSHAFHYTSPSFRIMALSYYILFETQV